METTVDDINLAARGLTEAEVERSRAEHGTNVFTPRERTPWWVKLAAKFKDPLIVILLIAALLSIGISFYEYFGLGAGVTAFFEPVGIIVAIALATGLAFWFEQRADREFSILSQQNDLEPVRVRRSITVPDGSPSVTVPDGSPSVTVPEGSPEGSHETLIPRADVVVGDIVLLATGDEVPADGQLLEATHMQVDESTLTGEPVCSKGVGAAAQVADATFPSDMVLRGSKLLEGHGVMRVTAVGDATECGRVFTETQIDSSVHTPLNEQLDRLGRLIARASYAVAALVVIGRVVQYAIHNQLFISGESISNFQFSIFNFQFLAYLLQSLMLAVTLIVVAVPEGLPMAVTLSLAYSMRSMLRTNNLVRRLHACETMGAATVICTDKTGTLTQNRMQVVEMCPVCCDYIATPASPATSSASLASPAVSPSIALNIALNSTASLDGDRVLGNPTEGALLLWLREQGVDYARLRAEARIVDETPFTTERKYMATRVASTDPHARDTLYIKGAPEVVMAMCDHSLTFKGESLKLHDWQSRGLRTLAFAHDGTLDALVAIADPVREDVPAAVQECLRAGIDVKIVTGDTPATAAEIARQIGLQPTPKSVLTGPEVAAMSDDELRRVARDICIIARARPQDKRRLVEALQAEGEVVAVTGDGTNDAPALKAAHVGLSMGSGTAVAKEASDITIIDDSFASIGRAVMWGRSLYRNIQRFILFQLTVNVCACLTVLAGAFMGMAAPLTVTQMLWVNLIMDTFAAMALASLPPTTAVMRERPRDRRRFIISRPMWHFIVGVGGLFFVLMTALLWHLERGGLTERELSLFFTTFVMLQFWNLFNARAFLTGESAFRLRGCRGFVMIAAIIFVGQVAIVQLGGQMFNVVPLSLREWLTIIVATSPVVLVGEAVRWAKRLSRKPVS